MRQIEMWNDSPRITPETGGQSQGTLGRLRVLDCPGSFRLLLGVMFSFGRCPFHLFFASPNTNLSVLQKWNFKYKLYWKIEMPDDKTRSSISWVCFRRWSSDNDVSSLNQSKSQEKCKSLLASLLYYTLLHVINSYFKKYGKCIHFPYSSCEKYCRSKGKKKQREWPLKTWKEKNWIVNVQSVWGIL